MSRKEMINQREHVAFSAGEESRYQDRTDWMKPYVQQCNMYDVDVKKVHLKDPTTVLSN